METTVFVEGWVLRLAREAHITKIPAAEADALTVFI